MGKKKIDVILSLVAGTCFLISAALDLVNGGTIKGNTADIALGVAFIALGVMWYTKKKK